MLSSKGRYTKLNIYNLNLSSITNIIRMSTQADNNKRIAKNTLVLYVRMLLTVGISFYSTRLILANLGVDNYGIYNVIGGFVSMFYMVSSTMTQAVGRFLTFELGIGNEKKLQQTFSTSINILLLLSLVVVLLAETVGLWFVNYKLNISAERMVAANWIYQFSVFSFILEMISVPYNASVISHEKMGTFAFITIVKVFLTLGISLLLSISPIDRLIFYGLLMFTVSVSIQLMYWIYCKKHFSECKYSIYTDRKIFKEMFGFAGWNFLTTCASMLSSQGVNIMLNMHFGTAINAARGISSQINGTIGAFSKNFMTAINPQITKSYATQEIEYTKNLVCNGAKFSYLLFFLIALPCLLETDFLLSIWLKEVPPYANIFVQFSILYSLVDVLLNTSDSLNRASGKIRNFQILVSTTQLLILVFSYLVINITDNPIWTIAVTNILYILIFVPRVIINKPFINITFRYYYKNVLNGIIIMSIFAVLLSSIPFFYLQEGWFRLIIVSLISTISIVSFSYLFVLTNGERKKILNFINLKIFCK